MDFNVTRTEFNQALLQFIQSSESWYLSEGEVPWQLCMVESLNHNPSQLNLKSSSSFEVQTHLDNVAYREETPLLYAKRTWIQPFSTPSSGPHYESRDLSLLSENEIQEEWTPSLISFNRFEVHLVYHSVYEVPVIYFQITPHPLSIPLTRLSEVQANLALPSVQIIQQIHPHLSLPFWLIHPCQTRSLMLPLLSFVSNQPYAWFYTWLSMFGQVFGGLLPFSLYNKLQINNFNLSSNLNQSEFITATDLLPSKNIDQKNQ